MRTRSQSVTTTAPIEAATPSAGAPHRSKLATPLRALMLTLLPALLMSLPAHAQSESDAVVDPPARVGRVSVLRGPVDRSSQPGGAWEPARLNDPVTGQTAFWSPPGSQLELRAGSASIRFDGNTQAMFSQLDDHGIAIDVAQGTVRARVRYLPTGDAFSLSADGVRAEAQVPGDYRVSYDPDRRAYTVRALAGRLRVVTASNSFNLEAGQESLVEGGGSTLQLRPIGSQDEFDRWAEARDQEQDRLASARYVSPEMTGIEALDEHGSWQVDAAYGPVWYPAVVAYDWAPYRYGRWAWVAPWGWTWVDDGPWGFAPFHYGRWARFGPRWGWVPGPWVARPVWAPALVGFVGGRSGNVGWGIGIGGGAPVGWFPLAPAEVYAPPYRHSVHYVNQVNIVNVIVTNGDPRRSAPRPALGDYRYARHPGALTVVSEESFRNGRRIERERINLTPDQTALLRPVIATLPGGTGASPRGSNPEPRRAQDVPRAAVLPVPPVQPREGRNTPAPREGAGGERFRPVPWSANQPRQPDGAIQPRPGTPAQQATEEPGPRPTRPESQRTVPPPAAGSRLDAPGPQDNPRARSPWSSGSRERGDARDAGRAGRAPGEAPAPVSPPAQANSPVPQAAPPAPRTGPLPAMPRAPEPPKVQVPDRAPPRRDDREGSRERDPRDRGWQRADPLARQQDVHERSGHPVAAPVPVARPAAPAVAAPTPARTGPDPRRIAAAPAEPPRPAPGERRGESGQERRER